VASGLVVAYRAYSLDPQGHITKRFEFEAADDVTAHTRRFILFRDTWQAFIRATGRSRGRTSAGFDIASAADVLRLVSASFH